MPQSVNYEFSEGLAKITLARPERRNILDGEMVQGLSEALYHATSNPKMRVVMLGAEGPAFCAGMDLKSNLLEDPVQVQRFSEVLMQVYRKLLTLSQPLVSAVDGPAMGGAVGLAMAADVAFAGPNARFAFPETRMGIMPALVSVVARRRMAPQKLAGLALTGIESGPQDALRLGIVDFVAAESASAEAEAFTRKIIRENSGEAMRRTKQFLNSQLFYPDLDRQLEAALREFRSAVTTDSCRKGLAAFRAKTPLRWDE